MSAQGGDFDGHVGIERKRLQDGMQFIIAGYLEYADIRESPYDAPEMLPLACRLKLCRPLMLELPEPLDRLSVNMRWNPYFDLDMKEHENISPLDRTSKARVRLSSTLSPVDDRCPATGG
jgi:hypothetical protein